MNKYILLILLVALTAQSCNDKNEKPDQPAEFAQNQLTEAAKQYNLLLKDAQKADKIPRTVDNGNIHWVNEGFDWTKGFFPGSCWYLYEFTGQKKWMKAADAFQSSFENFKNSTGYHDLGFVFNNSYGNGYRITGREEYKQVLITAANSLSERFNPKVGAIKSWDVDKGWQSERGWKFPVIIDNMMNLELLFEVSEITGDSSYYEIAKSHADATLKNHFRDDYSSYHVVDFDPETGKVRSKETAQGYADESSWARGQAWGLYGFTMSYRYTKDPKYLTQAEEIAAFILNNNSIPSDHIPYWDYDAEDVPNEPRDASAAAITASALIELDGYSEKEYLQPAENILHSLSSDRYKANIGSNNHFILKHSVGSIPHDSEIDVPLNYADYYYIEALLRYKKHYENED